MPLTKIKKAEKIEQLTRELEGSTSAIVGSFTKLTVLQDFELRKVVRGAGGRYRVLKNKLAARAAQGTGVEAALQGLKGVSSVAYTSGDPVALAKALSTWVADNAEFTFKLGIVDGKVISIEEIKQLATMPSKEEIYAKLLFLISSPAQRLATVINATGRNLAVVINQGVEKGKFTAASEAAPVPATLSVPDAPSSSTAEAPSEPPVVQAAAPSAPPAEPPAVQAAAVEAHAAETVSPSSDGAHEPSVESTGVESTGAESTGAMAAATESVEPAGTGAAGVATEEAAVAQETAEAESPAAALDPVPESQATAASTEEPVEGAPVAEEAIAGSSGETQGNDEQAGS